MIDDQLTIIDEGDTLNLGDGSLSYQILDTEPIYIVNYSTGEELTINHQSNPIEGFEFLDIGFFPSTNELVGLLGNSNGNPDDDLALRDGTILDPSTPTNELLGNYAESWQVNPEASFF